LSNVTTEARWPTQIADVWACTENTYV